MQPFAKALEVITQVMRQGATTHPGNDWRESTAAEQHVRRAERHLRLLLEGDQAEDHVVHACCRLLMAITLRERE